MFRLLIIEDVSEIRELLAVLATQSLPSQLGEVSVRTAENLPSARLEIARHRPNLILLDEMLPGESALDLLDSPETRGIALWLMTGMGKDSLTRPIPEGAQGRIQKPPAVSDRVFAHHLSTVALGSLKTSGAVDGDGHPC